MPETVKKDDFVELEYTGVLKDLNAVFDTTSEETAKKEGIHDPKMTYGPVSICIGQGQILQGLDSSLEGLEVGKEHELTLPPEKAFGKKDGKHEPPPKEQPAKITVKEMKERIARAKTADELGNIHSVEMMQDTPRRSVVEAIANRLEELKAAQRETPPHDPQTGEVFDEEPPPQNGEFDW